MLDDGRWDRALQRWIPSTARLSYNAALQGSAGHGGIHSPEPRFIFQLTPHRSRTYGPPASTWCHIERPDGSQDFVFSTSLFTHLLEAEVLNYVAESYRVLRSQGLMQMNFFSLDLATHDHLGGRWTFRHAMGRARVESLQYPEAAVGYTDADLTSIARDAGFSRVVVVRDPPGR